jgi:hypothetical protein
MTGDQDVICRDVTSIMEKHRHKLRRRFQEWRGIRGLGRSRVSMGEPSRKLTNYTNETATFLIILEVLLTT